MALKLVTAAQMRQIDRTTADERGISGLELMERAGRAVAEEIVRSYAPGTVGIVVGKGNNAGDGLVVARYLAEKDLQVVVLMLAREDALSEAGRVNLGKLPEAVRVVDRAEVAAMEAVFSDCDVVVDAILGTGIVGAVRGTYGEAIALLNGLAKPVVAVDIPSGLNADTGEAEGACIEADMTITMGLPKLGMLLREGPKMCGDIVVADIGFPEDLIEDPELKVHLLELLDVQEALPVRPRDGHKGTFGSLIVIAGSRGMSGAAFLTTSSALRSGCGMVYAAFPASVVAALEAHLVEAVKIPVPEEEGSYLCHHSWETLERALGKADAIALGPGIGTNPDTARLVDEIVCQDLPIVIDADALNCLGTKVSYLSKRAAPTIVTPHPGEMARLMGLSTAEVQANRLEVAARLAADAQVVVVLKGAQTVVAEPGGRIFINPTANSGMAKGGSGDVLTGLIGGLLAQGCSALDAACIGVYIHGMAGDLARDAFGERGMTSGDILAQLPQALMRCDEI